MESTFAAQWVVCIVWIESETESKVVNLKLPFASKTLYAILHILSVIHCYIYDFLMWRYSCIGLCRECRGSQRLVCISCIIACIQALAARIAAKFHTVPQ